MTKKKEKLEERDIDYLATTVSIIREWFFKKKVTNYKELVELTNFLMNFSDDNEIVNYVNIPEYHGVKIEKKIEIIKECLNDFDDKNSVKVLVLGSLGRMKVVRKYDKLIKIDRANVINLTAVDMIGLVRRVSIMMPPYNDSNGYTISDVFLGDPDWEEIKENDEGDIIPWTIISSFFLKNINKSMKRLTK